MRILVDDIEEVVVRMRSSDGLPQYIYGHMLEINNRLKTQYNALKFPLVALILDTPETMVNGLVNYNLRVLIVEYTSKTTAADQRYDTKFKPVLIPLYERFLLEIKKSGLFMWPGDQTAPPHIKYDRLFWGTEVKDKGNKSYIMDDPLDAIELINLKLVSTNKTC